MLLLTGLRPSSIWVRFAQLAVAQIGSKACRQHVCMHMYAFRTTTPRGKVVIVPGLAAAGTEVVTGPFAVRT